MGNFWGSAGTGIISGGLGLLGSLVSGAYQRKTAEEQTRLGAELGLRNAKEMAGVNFRYNEQAADNAAGRSKDLAKFNQELGLDTTAQLWEKYNSPAAKAKAIKDAGLSIGLMYSGGGAQGTIGTQAASGAAPQGGTSGPGAGSAAIGQGIQLGLGKIASEAALNAALAKQANANANKIEKTTEPEIAKISAETKQINENTNLIIEKTKSEKLNQLQTKANTALTELQAFSQELENNFNQTNYKQRIAEYNHLVNEAFYRATKTYYEAENTKMDSEIKRQTKDSICEQVRANLKETQARILLIGSQNKLTEQQAENAVQQLYLIVEQQALTHRQTVSEYLKWYYEADNQEIANRRIAAELEKAGIMQETMILSSLIGAGGNITGQLMNFIFPAQAVASPISAGVWGGMSTTY